MNISEAGLELIASFEGLSTTLYNDPDGHCTIGVGLLVHLGPCDGREEEAPYRDGITEAQAYDLLREKVQGYADAVERCTVPVNQNQFDALTSLCFNIGPGGYINSSVRTAVNSGGDVCFELRKYVRGVSGVIYPGLIRRREAECALYETPWIEPSAVEEEEMKPLLVWDLQRQTVYLIGPFGAAHVAYPADKDAFEKLYGPMTVALSSDAIDAIGVVK